MDASASAGRVLLNLDYPEAVVLHEALAYLEWSGELEGVNVDDPMYLTILSRLQAALAPQVRELGTSGYSAAVRSALDAVRSTTAPQPEAP